VFQLYSVTFHSCALMIFRPNNSLEPIVKTTLGVVDLSFLL
jgi:hypothetical protein